MKFPLALSILLLVQLSSLVADEVLATVRFSNNDRLSGSIESLTTERLVWKSPILAQASPFFLKNVLDLTLVPERRELAANHEARLSLTNGDEVRGQLVAVAEDFVELETWFAGRVKFNRLMISGIEINERRNLIFRGPDGLGGWVQSGAQPAWDYQNAAFRSGSAGSIARDVALPDECSVAFDAAWRGSLGLRVALFSKDTSSDRPSSGYELTFQQRSIYLRSSKTQRFLGHTPHATALQENERARIEVRASLKSGKICVLVDDVLVDVWTDPDIADTEVGRGIHFIAQNALLVQVSRIEVAEWDGEVGELPDRQAGGGMDEFGGEAERRLRKVDKPKAGRMELRNGDSITGEVLAISEGRIVVKTPFREVRLPIENLRSVALKPVALERCKRENGDVRGWFPDGSSLVFRLDRVRPGILTGYSQNFGVADFKLAAFNRIEFNIYDPALEEVRQTNAW
jgi:hypothetical protein